MVKSIATSVTIAKLTKNSLHRGEKQILCNIDWEIKQNNHWALLGPNGSGKTTLLKILSCNQWPSSGRVEILNQEFGKVDLREIKNKIGWVSSFLTEKIPVAENCLNVIISGKFSSFGIFEKIPKKFIEEARQLTKLLNIHHIEYQKFILCSQGEKQKTLIARALISNPILLILDEPCTGLDPKARDDLLNTIKKIEKQTTIIYVTHHTDEIIKEIPNILMLKNGEIFKKGKKSKILTQDNIAELFDTN